MKQLLSFICLAALSVTLFFPAQDLYGILLDETATTNVILSFWADPWYYKEKKIQARHCQLKIKAIRLVTRESINQPIK